LPAAQVTEVIFGFGHENIQATHHATVEFTKDAHLSRNGDCILVVATDKGLADLSPEFKVALQQPHAKLTIKIEAGGISEEIHAHGSQQLVLTHPQEMVIRKSDYPSDRTLGIHADKAAKDLSRELVEKLKNPKQKTKITLTVHA
jgi:uncharacterized protein